MGDGVAANDKGLWQTFDLDAREEDFEGFQVVDEIVEKEEYDLEELNESQEDFDMTESEHSSDQFSDQQSNSPQRSPPTPGAYSSDSGLPLRQSATKDCYLTCPSTNQSLQILLPQDIHTLPVVDLSYLLEVEQTLQKYVTNEYLDPLLDASNALLISWGAQYNQLISQLRTNPSSGAAPRSRVRSRTNATVPSKRARRDAPPDRSAPPKRVDFRSRSPIRPPAGSPDPRDPLGLQVSIDRRQGLDRQDGLSQAHAR